ncbi:uncharacterized protein KY384_000846 [Bacidia gigantensis]|uniref:uncharacterized protein n=1 Tax=Bacidia gigantensis TaxID=2732470 RepID=UPI001D0475DD|nr:uncharacterized protein KY384_000846 [Bacidia gigantensis]KAG8534004.1 hypothetical protein KY384_000846 [Bacidia gigantensis]
MSKKETKTGIGLRTATAIYLMGHGLVAGPRRLFRNANLPERLRRIQSQAPKTHEKLTDATTELEELEGQLVQLRRRKNAVSRDHEEWIEEISDASSIRDFRLPAATNQLSAPELPAVITDRYLADFSRRLMRARHKRLRFVDEWDRVVQEAADVQAVVDAAASKQLDFGKASPSSSWVERIRFLTPYTRYLLHSKVIPGVRMFFGAIFALASVCIVWSELIKFVAPRLSIISFTILSHPQADTASTGFRGQVTAALWLMYMSLCTLASFSDVKIWGNRALVPRNTYGESATWYSSQVAKLTVPLAYNFITFLPPSIHRETTFYGFLGQLINLTPLGKWFDYFFPIFILFPVCATLFNLYSRVQRIFGFGIIDEDVESGTSALGTGGWREGRDLINRELQSSARLGLASRSATDGASSPLPPGNQSPRRNTPNANPSNANARPELGRQSTGARQAQRLADATLAAEQEDESFFEGFAHRVKNTFDTIERPSWLDELGKRPKWMGGVEGNQESSGRAESGRGLGRWFGGRGDDGRIRL